MPGQTAAGPSLVQGLLIPLGFMFLIIYVIVFRPQVKAQKAHEQMLKNLRKNDEVVTTGGLFGTVVNVKPESITLRIDDNVRVEVERSAISRLVKPKAEPAPSAAGRPA